MIRSGYGRSRRYEDQSGWDGLMCPFAVSCSRRARAGEEERARRLEASYLRSLRLKGSMRRKDLQDRLPQVNCPVRAGKTWLTEGLCG